MARPGADLRRAPDRTSHKDYRPEGYSRSRGVELVIVDNAECYELMQQFIAAHPELWNEDIGEE